MELCWKITVRIMRDPDDFRLLEVTRDNESDPPFTMRSRRADPETWEWLAPGGHWAVHNPDDPLYHEMMEHFISSIFSG